MVLLLLLLCVQRVFPRLSLLLVIYRGVLAVLYGDGDAVDTVVHCATAAELNSFNDAAAATVAACAVNDGAADGVDAAADDCSVVSDDSVVDDITERTASAAGMVRRRTHVVPPASVSASV